MAAAAGLAPLAVGTKTNGSIVCPSSVNGIVGVKPTVGLVSRTEIVPILHTQDTAGPMACSVTDTAALLNAMTDVDASDAATAGSAGHVQADYSEFLDNSALQGACIGLLTEYYGRHFEMDRIVDDGAAALRAAGAEVVDTAALPGVSGSRTAGFEVMLYEFKAGLNQ